MILCYCHVIHYSSGIIIFGVIVEARITLSCFHIFTVCTRLNDIDAALKKLCDKLDIQADQLETLLGLSDPIVK